MATAKLILTFDGGSKITVEETSLLPIHGGTQGVALAQAAFEKVIRACGLQTMTPDEVREEAERAAAADPGPQADQTPAVDTPAPKGEAPPEAAPAKPTPKEK